jgi:hypothetical protein
MPGRFELKHIELGAMQLVRISLWTFALMDTHQINSKSNGNYTTKAVNTISEAFFAFSILMFIHAFLKHISFSTRTMQTLMSEIETSKKNLCFFSSGKELEKKLRSVTPVTDEPNAWIYNFNSTQVLIRDTEERIHHDIKKWHNLLSQLEREHSMEYQMHLDKIPKKLSILNFFQRPFGFEWDWSSKMRMVDNYFGMLSAILLFKVISFYQLYPEKSPAASAVMLLSTPIFFIISFRENFLQKEQEWRFNLRGIQTRLTKYNEFPPTCIGRQFTAKRLFVGSNEALNEAVQFLLTMVQLIDGYATIERHPSSPIWREMVVLREEMRQYFAIEEQNTHQASIPQKFL